MSKEIALKLNDYTDLFLLAQIETFDYIPILFVAGDNRRNLYLCLCTEIRDLQRWVVSSTNISVLNELINHRITINEAFRRDESMKYIVEYNQTNGYAFTPVLIDNIDPLHLPDVDVYAEYVEREAYNFVGFELKKAMYAQKKQSDIGVQPTLDISYSLNSSEHFFKKIQLSGATHTSINIQESNCFNYVHDQRYIDASKWSRPTSLGSPADAA